MRQLKKMIFAFVIIAGFCSWSAWSAWNPNIWYFTQSQDAASTAGKLIITYMPILSETPGPGPYQSGATGPYLTGADISWIITTKGQRCNTSSMQHVSANKFTFAVDAAPGDTIDYFFTQRWIGNLQNFY
jgi:hypothetical protein